MEDSTATINGKEISTREVVRRYAEILDRVGTPTEDIWVSPAILKSIEELNKPLSRDVSLIEVAPSASSDIEVDRKPVRVNETFVNDVATARKSLQHMRSEFVSLVGILRAVDTIDKRLRFELPSGLVVSGRFQAVLQPKMIQCLDRRVKLTGDVRFVDTKPCGITAHGIDPVPV